MCIIGMLEQRAELRLCCGLVCTVTFHFLAFRGLSVAEFDILEGHNVLLGNCNCVNEVFGHRTLFMLCEYLVPPDFVPT